MDSRRLLAFTLLAAANLMWSGNWVLGRALRETFDPITLNFWRWLIAALVMAPFALPQAVTSRALIRRHAALLCLLGLTGVVLFQSLVYLGLETTTTINAVLINAAGPLFMLLCSWILERDTATPRQVVPSFDQWVTQWMSRVTSSAGRVWNCSQVHVRGSSTAPLIVNDHWSSGVWGVGPADSTGKSLTTYWPGGTRSASARSASWRRWKPRENGGLMAAELTPGREPPGTPTSGQREAVRRS